MRGVSPLIRGSGGLPGKFLKLDCLRVHFHAIFKSFSLILQADFFFSDNFRKSRVRKLLGQHSFVGSCSPSHLIQEGQLSVSGKRMCTVLVNYLCISLPRKCGYVN